MQMPAEKQHNDLQARLLRYRTSTTVFRSMVKSGILTEADYRKSCDILAEKYGISLCSIKNAQYRFMICTVRSLFYSAVNSSLSFMPIITPSMNPVRWWLLQREQTGSRIRSISWRDMTFICW